MAVLDVPPGRAPQRAALPRRLGEARFAMAAGLCLALAWGCGRAADPAPPLAAPPAESWLSEKKLYSSGNEELIIRDFFRDRRNGVFVDVGCAWPVRKSNTAYLELHLGWSGIAVDALREYGAAWQRDRPRSKFFALFVTDHEGEVQTFYRSELPDVSSYQKRALELRTRKDGEPLEFDALQVPTTTLTTLLLKNGIAKVDFLSMDIEGAEPLALAGFDIDSFKPELACVEAKPANRADIRRYFGAHGYDRLERYVDYDKMNYYFAPRAPR